MKPRLISFKLCPFVQRAVIALQAKGIEYDVEYIDLAAPPQWFLDISPLKKVPLLLIGDDVIFESAVINEYIDEAYANKLHPQDLVLRAKNRSWIEFGNACMWSVFHLSVKQTQQEIDEVLTDMWSKFDQIERALNATPYFNGFEFSLVDASYAPLFQRLEYLEELTPGIFDKQRHPRINAWKDILLAEAVVKRSTVVDIKALYLESLWKRQGYMARYLDADKYDQSITKSTY
ncbi:MAG: glutathione S-transferase family protein [Amphritea sp.]